MKKSQDHIAKRLTGKTHGKRPEMCMKTVQYIAPAKINLFLHITGKRADGYHQLQTLFQFVNWYDRISFTPNLSGKITFSCNLPSLASDNNLVIRAARLLQQTTAMQRFGVHIDLQKNIPSGAGLGGGSSDAAVTLMALNHLWQGNLDQHALIELGLQLGADVPVFIYGHACWAEGIGEQCRTMQVQERHYCLVKPDISISTSALFQNNKLQRNCPPLEPKNFSLQQTHNVFQPLVMAQYPQVAANIRTLAQWIKTQGFDDKQAVFNDSFRMTGTGSVFFLPVSSQASANEICKQLPENYQVKIVRSFNHFSIFDKKFL